MANLRADNLCGVGFVSANDGTVWSDYVTSTTGSTLSNYPATYGFDGNLSNFVYADNNSLMTWTPPNGGIKAGLIEVYVYAGNTHPLVRVNGVSTGAVVGSDLGQQGNWVDVTDLVGGHLKTIEADGYTISGTARSSGWSAVRINGEILVDGEQGTTGGRNAIDGSVQFGGYVDATSEDYLKTADLDDYDVGTGDFTFEAWVYPVSHVGTNSPNYMSVFSAWTYHTGMMQVQIKNDGKLRCNNNGTIDQTGTTVLWGNWHHIAFARSGSTLKGFVNGVEEISFSYSSAIDFAYGGASIVGASAVGNYPGDYPFRGFISNLRLIKGSALYTASFTPPTEKLTAVDGTVLLCCQDSDNALQEATGKTLTGFGRYFAATGELFANTGFSADSDWTKGSGWTISGNVATHAQGTAGDLYQAVSGLVVGETYKLSVDIITSDDDVAYFYIDNEPGGNYPALGNGSNAVVGHYQYYFEANATTMNIGFRGSSLWAGTLTNLRLSSADHGKAPKVLPSVGVDAGVTFEGDTKVNSQGYMYFPTGDTSQRGRGRAVFFGGYQGTSPAAGVTNIDYLNIQSGGISQSFGTLLENRRFGAGLASATRGVTGGSDGQPAWATGTMEYVTIATTSNSTTFGNMTQAGGMVSACSNNTRGLFFSVWDANTSGSSHKKHIDYVTIASAGNSADFGELSVARPEAAGFGSPTRGICAGGYDALSPNNPQDTIDYVTIATTGNATDFGNLTVARQASGSASSSTRGVIAGGYASPAWQNTIDYVTIATTGNATDFGDLVTALYGQFVGNCSDKIRGVFAGGKISAPTFTNSIDYVTIATTGNTQDFGDIVRGTSGYGSIYGSICSDSHGGLS